MAGSLHLTGGAITAPDLAAFRPTDWSVELWVSLDAVSSWQYVASHTIAGAGGFALAVDSLNRPLATVSSASGSQTIVGSTVMTAGTWYHIALTWDATAGTVALYLDGAQEGSFGLGAGYVVWESASQLEVGTRLLGFGASRAAGYYDEVRFWDVCRTSGEIAAHYDQTGLPAQTGLIGYWRLDDGSGTTATDETATAADMTASGSYAWSASGAPLTEPQSASPPVATLTLSAAAPVAGPAAFPPVASLTLALYAPRAAWVFSADQMAGSVRYRVTLTGYPDPLPCSSVSARVADASSTYLQAVIPDAAPYASAVAGVGDSLLSLDYGRVQADGTTLWQTMIQTRLDGVDLDCGPNSTSATLRGRLDPGEASRTGDHHVEITGVSYQHAGSGARRFRAVPVPWLLPADLANFAELGVENVRVGSIVYTLGPLQQTMEIEEAA